MKSTAVILFLFVGVAFSVQNSSATSLSFQEELSSTIKTVWGAPQPFLSTEPTKAKDTLQLLLGKLRAHNLKKPASIYLFPSKEKIGLAHKEVIYLSTSLFQMFNDQLYATYVIAHLFRHGQQETLKKQVERHKTDLAAWVKGEKTFSEESEDAADRYAYFMISFLGYDLSKLATKFTHSDISFFPCQANFKHRVNFLRRTASIEMNKEGSLLKLKKANYAEITRSENLEQKAFTSFKQGLLLGSIGALGSLISKDTPAWKGGTAGFTAGFLAGLFLNVHVIEW